MGLDRRYAAVRLQALDRAMQAAKVNTAAPTQKVSEQHNASHSSLDPAGGTWPQTTRGGGLGSIRDEIRKVLAPFQRSFSQTHMLRTPNTRALLWLKVGLSNHFIKSLLLTWYIGMFPTAHVLTRSVWLHDATPHIHKHNH